MVLRAGELGYKIWTRSADHHTGQRLLKMPHIKGLTEDRTRSHIQKVRNFLHNGRQPQKNHRFRLKSLLALFGFITGSD
jgi:hypothetical protein